MNANKISISLLAALAMVLSLTGAQPAKAISPQNSGPAAPTPPLLSNISAIDLGEYRTCALTSGGGVKCWGSNWNGELGIGTYTYRFVPTDVRGLTSGVSAISVGGYHTCALKLTGGIKCWGYNGKGQLGDGTTSERTIPVGVSGMSSGVQAIAAGEYHTCALTLGGAVMCWGANAYGQLGDGTTEDRLTPTGVIGLSSGVIAISAGGYNTCALTSTGGIKCWGENASGQLGDDTTDQRLTPTDVFGLTSGMQSVSAGGFHTCALSQTGAAMCWGRNQYGQLGNGQNTNSPRPVAVNGLSSGASAIVAGKNHACAINSNGGVECWGRNYWGELGDGTIVNRNIPVVASGLSTGTVSVTASKSRKGFGSTCALTSSNQVKCWGKVTLGDGEPKTRQTIPADVLALSQITIRSNGPKDGFIQESSETSNTGSIANSSAKYIHIGDDDQDRQLLAILSFNTYVLPDTSVIFSARIKLYEKGIVGFPWWSQMKVDIRKPFFGTSAWLQPSDFESPPSMALVGFFPTNGNTDLSKLKPESFPYIDLTGTTQFRIRKKLADNDNMTADYFIYYSGDAQTNYRPELTILFFVP